MNTLHEVVIAAQEVPTISTHSP